MDDENQESYATMEEENQDDYESMDEDSSDNYEEMDDESQEDISVMEVESTGNHSASDDWGNQSDGIQAMEDADLSNTYSSVRVYAKHLQSPGAFQQVCLGQWAPDEVRESSVSVGAPKLAHTDVVLGKGSYISLCRFTEYDTEQPSGSWEVIHEQPVFGAIKDLKAVSIDFEDENDNEEYGVGYYTDISSYNETPRMGYLPKSASKTLLVATSDTGFLTFLAFHYDDQVQSPESRGHFYAVKKIDITEPGHDMSEVGAMIAIDSTKNVLAVSGLEGIVRLFFLGKTRRSSFDPVTMISSLDVKGTVIAVDFLYVDPNAELVVAILGILYFNKDSGKHYISTFHIGAPSGHRAPPIHTGTSELGSSHFLSALLLKGLPELPYCMVYVDEENVTYVTTEQLTAPDGTTIINHTHHKPLKLMKKEPHANRSSIDDAGVNEDIYPLITACATPPRSSTPDGHQTLYLGSDTSDFYRVNINGLDNTMHFELHTGERPIGRVMEVIAGSHTRALSEPEQGQATAHMDYLLYSSEHGNGSVLGVKEEENGTIGVFSISELSNDAPVLDFCADEPALPGCDSLFVCSGMKSEGCIKRVRSGVLVESSGSSGQQRFDGATGVWSVKAKREDPYDSFLVVSFIQSTKLMRVGKEGEFEDVSEHCGLTLSQATIAAGRLMDGAIFQVHRAGVVVVWPQSGRKCEWTSGKGVLASASWAREGILVLGKVLPGASSIIVLELAETLGDSKEKPAPYSFRVIASNSIDAEPTTIYCWNSVRRGTELDSSSAGVQFCVGTLAPAIYVFFITGDTIEQVYAESLAQERENVAAPHAISVLRNGEGSQRILVGLRNGSIIVYEWNQQRQRGHSFFSAPMSGRIMSLPRLFNLGVMPVKFAYSGEPLQTKVLILSDKIWQAGFKGNNEFEVQPILSDNEVSQACAFEWQETEGSTRPGFVFIIDHQDLQLVTLQGKRKYDSQTLPLGHSQGHELTEEWAMDMSMPVFAISPFKEKLLEKASARERWPVVQISSQEKIIVTGSRGESISFYEYEAGSGEHSFDKLKFFRSARSARQVSDCLAITPELAVGVDLSGCIFGVGYTPGVVNQQYSLVDQFSFHMGEIVTRIRLAKLWLDEGRSLSGIPLPLPTSTSSASSSSVGTAAAEDLARPPSFMSLLLPHILIPWTPIDTVTYLDNSGSIGNEQQSSTSNATERTTAGTRSSSPQALIGYSLVGSIFGFWRLDPHLYSILKALQRVLATFYESRPVLGANHGAFRSGHANTSSGINGDGGGSRGSPTTKAFHTIDGDLLDRFLGLDHAAQIEVVDRAIRLEGMVQEWIRRCDNKSTNTSNTKTATARGSALAEALDREMAMSNCNEHSGAPPKCADRALARRSMYLNEDGRFLQRDHQHVPGTASGKQGSRWAEEEDQGEDEGEDEEEGSGKPLDIYHVPCAAIHVLSTVLLFLRNLDWHQ
ncbi:hypothetical protein BGW39_008668 [Mortierella sp. 14UC]|nr:hypothetical protein BGW39_008668 [Mortierella sp. 14UC]